jgi:hypothetical protein
MAIDESSPARTGESAQASSGADELGALLAGYASVLETIDDAPAVLWTKLEGHRLLRWVRVPAPRTLVRAFLVRHVSRCVSTLKRRAARRAALAGDAPGPLRDLKMLEHFEQSLATGLRLALIWPLALLGVLLVAYVLAHFGRAAFSQLLADLTTAAVDLDRGAAIDAFKSAHLGALPYLGAAMIIAWSVTLVIVPLLPAFSVKRRLLAQLEEVEAHGFAALGARRVHDFELDLIAQILLAAPIALAIIPPENAADVYGWTNVAIVSVLMIFAGVELRSRFRVRRAGAEPRRRRIARLSLRLMWLSSAGVFIWLISPQGDQPTVIEHQIGEEGGARCPADPEEPCEMEFTVTAIQPNAACSDPYRPLKPGQQFLRFDLDVSSTVDRFSDPGLANALSLRHWGVEGSDGVLEKDIYMYTKCSDGTEAVWQPIVPGTHTKTVVVINAPQQAAFLQLDIPNEGRWRWPVPGAGS